MILESVNGPFLLQTRGNLTNIYSSSKINNFEMWGFGVLGLYIPQVQGCIWLCEQDHWDFMSYHPDARPLIVRVERDEEYIDGLSKHLNEFIVKLNDAKALIMGEGNEKI